MKKFCLGILLLLVTFLALAWTPTDSSFDPTQFGTNGFKIFIKNGALTTNLVPATIIRSNATTAEIQAAFDKGGTIWFEPFATFTLTTNIVIRRGVTIEGNEARLAASSGMVGPMLDSGTVTLNGQFNMRGLRVDGTVRNNFYGNSLYFRLLNGTPTPYYNYYQSNLAGLRISSSSGGIIEGNKFFGWPGNALMLVNSNGLMAYQYPRINVVGNEFYSNFVGAVVIGANYEYPGYYNAVSGTWSNASAEYTIVANNKFQRNYIGLSDGSGNASVQNNAMTENQIGFFLGSAANAQHGLYLGNTINHNLYGAWQESGQAGQWRGNNFLANSFAGYIGSSITDLIIEGNWFGNGDKVIITNASDGRFVGNFYQGTWSSFAPNIVGTVYVCGNLSADDITDSDGCNPGGGGGGTNAISYVTALYNAIRTGLNPDGLDFVQIRDTNNITVLASTNNGTGSIHTFNHGNGFPFLYTSGQDAVIYNKNGVQMIRFEQPDLPSIANFIIYSSEGQEAIGLRNHLLPVFGGNYTWDLASFNADGMYMRYRGSDATFYGSDLISGTVIPGVLISTNSTTLGALTAGTNAGAFRVITSTVNSSATAQSEQSMSLAVDDVDILKAYSQADGTGVNTNFLSISRGGSSAGNRTYAGYYSGNKTLTDNTATTFINIPVAAGEVNSVQLFCTVFATDGTDHQVASSRVITSAVNKAGTVSVATPDDDPATAPSYTGTLTVSYSATVTGNSYNIRVTADTSLTPTSMRIEWTVVANNGTGRPTIIPQ